MYQLSGNFATGEPDWNLPRDFPKLHDEAVQLTRPRQHQLVEEHEDVRSYQKIVDVWRGEPWCVIFQRNHRSGQSARTNNLPYKISRVLAAPVILTLVPWVVSALAFCPCSSAHLL